MARTLGKYYPIVETKKFKKRYKHHWGVDYDIEQAKNCIIKFKENLIEIFNTRFYQNLKEFYTPRVFKYRYNKRGEKLKDKNGDYLLNEPPIIQFDLPDLEDIAFTMGKFRQIFLTNPYDRVSIHNFRIHVLTIDNDSSTKLYNYLKEKLEFYLNAFTGTHFRWSTREEKTIEMMRFRIIDWFDQANYGGGKLAHDSLKHAVRIGDIGSINKITEYFLGCMVLLCRIGMIYQYENLNDDRICKNQCPFRIYYGDDSSFFRHSDCKALPIDPSRFHVSLKVDDTH